MEQNNYSVDYNIFDPEKTFHRAIDSLIEQHNNISRLAPKDFKKLNALNKGREPFVEKAVDIATQNPELFPPSFGIGELRKQYQTYLTHRDQLKHLMQLVDLIKQKCYTAGHEVYAQARTLQKILRSQCTCNPTAQNCLEELEERNYLKVKG